MKVRGHKSKKREEVQTTVGKKKVHNFAFD